jgi:hypothetical protein
MEKNAEDVVAYHTLAFKILHDCRGSVCIRNRAPCKSIGAETTNAVEGVETNVIPP